MTAYVIIGNGIAGISAAEAVRTLDPSGAITFIAEERAFPYSRPMITWFLEGAVARDRLSLRGHNFYRRFDIQVHAGERAVSIDVGARCVHTDCGRVVDYDRLLIATGATPRPVKAEGAELPGVSCLRTVAHAESILEALHPGVRKAVVVGGGLVGFKAAYALRRRGLKVTMVIGSGHPLSMQVDRFAGTLILDELIANGLEVRLGVEVSSFEGNGRLREVRLSDGSSVPCELAIIGKGVTPTLDFVPKDKIKTDLGIVTDDHGETSCPGVYAAGDAAQSMDVVRGTTWVNAIQPVAVEQGRIAGANMAGRPVRYQGSMGRNVMRVFGLDIMTGGVVNPRPDEGYTTLSRYDQRRGLYRALTLKGDAPVGMVMVGGVEQGGVILALIRRGSPPTVSPDSLLSPDFNFGALTP